MIEGGEGRAISGLSLSPGRLAQIACLLEVTARKPGNVHRFADFESLHYLDFLLSATAVVEPLDQAGSRGLGVTILEAVKATRRVVSTNSNLGMILLLVPLSAVGLEADLEEAIKRVLSATSVEDARLTYRAIRLAEPGGLGRVEEQDVANEPDLPLRTVMMLAAERDLIARQYANGFEEVLHEALPLLREALRQDHPLETAIVACHLGMLARHPDSLILRKHGAHVAREVSARAARVLDSGWPDSAQGVRRKEELDAWLRADENRFNPGTTADLVTAALYAALREGTIRLPRPPGHAAWSPQNLQRGPGDSTVMEG